MKYSKREIKNKVQDELLSAIGIAFNRLEEEFEPTDTRKRTDEQEKLYQENYRQMDAQFKRIEKLFGVIPGSTLRGI